MTTTCTTHPTSPWITTQGQHKCRGCESARKRDWTRKRRAAGLLPAQTPDALAARRVTDRDTYAWRGVHAAYSALCDRMGIPDSPSTPPECPSDPAAASGPQRGVQT